MLVTLAIPLQRPRPRARAGPPRFPGSPSCDSAPVHDPGRPLAPRRSRRFRCCPQIDHTEGVVIATLEAHCDASSPAVYASRRALPHAMQDSLPAGGLRLCRAGVEPAGQRRKVSDHLILLPRTSPGARSDLDADQQAKEQRGRPPAAPWRGGAAPLRLRCPAPAAPISRPIRPQLPDPFWGAQLLSVGYIQPCV